MTDAAPNNNEDDENNISQQCDEIEALTAIYGGDFVVVDSKHRIYEIRVSSELDSWWSATLQVLLPPQYPSKVPPVFELHSAWMTEADKFEIGDNLYNIFRDCNGEIVLYQWVEYIREFVDTRAKEREENQGLQEGFNKLRVDQPGEAEGGDEEEDSSSDELDESFQSHWDSNERQQIGGNGDPSNTGECPEILHGEPFTERKSTFQAHLAQVVSVEQVNQVLENLKTNRKVANASHNIMAYRIYLQETNSYKEDNDNDGEACAGGRLAHLLQILNIKNVVIVVSRWFGGILLGPERFKHITNCARDLLKISGLLEPREPSAAQKEGKGKKSRLKTHKYKFTLRS